MSKKILIAEDERSLAKMLRDKLKRYGFKVTCAYNGKDALKKIKKEKPDLLLLDIIMPEKDGLTVLKEIKEDKKMRELLVIIVSNIGQRSEIEEAMNLGANDYIVKSNLSIAAIIKKIELLLK